MEKSILNGKVLVALGDSLFHGNKLGNGATWINKLGEMCGMTVYNHGINGNTLALNTINQKHPPMCVRYADMEDDADYVVVIGGGPAGLAAAYSACGNGAKSVLVIERDKEVGGILNQCVHNGFGLHYFKEQLTGPEYAGRFADMVSETQTDVMVDTMVLDITPDREIHCVNSKDGYMTVKAGAIVLCMGCRERTRGAIAIPGDRPAGILTAGTAQRYVNMEGYMPGKKVVILGSGDIGLIMARRMTLEGAKVLAVVELCPYSTVLTAISYSASTTMTSRSTFHTP